MTGPSDVAVIRIAGEHGGTFRIDLPDRFCWWIAEGDDEGDVIDPRAIPRDVVAALGSHFVTVALRLADLHISCAVDVPEDVVRLAARLARWETEGWRRHA